MVLYFKQTIFVIFYFFKINKRTTIFVFEVAMNHKLMGHVVEIQISHWRNLLIEFDIERERAREVKAPN